MTAEEAKKKIEQLTREVNYHNDLYYQQSRTQISDFEFDQLLETLVTLEKQFPPSLTSQTLPICVSAMT